MKLESPYRTFFGIRAQVDFIFRKICVCACVYVRVTQLIDPLQPLKLCRVLLDMFYLMGVPCGDPMFAAPGVVAPQCSE